MIISCGLITPLITVMQYTDDIGKATAIFGDVDRVLELKNWNVKAKAGLCQKRRC